MAGVSDLGCGVVIDAISARFAAASLPASGWYSPSMVLSERRRESMVARNLVTT